MKNKKIILKGVLILTMIFSNISFVYANNKQDEMVGIAEFIDENGNITEIEVQDGTTGEDETEEVINVIEGVDYGFENIEEKNVYKFRPNLIMKYKIPIEIDLKYNN